ncbi:MAG: thiamine-phosphate kinase [Gammaproteobacteria bacterium]|nr:thiamine-phosphate kinase [Gammaproteobacteria bacterium]NNK32850.1 thiamine-phosphate kinase [Xanthomonadales bacterium]
MDEFALIQRLQELICGPVNSAGPDCAVGIGDDGAVLDIPRGKQLVVCTDTLSAGVHFPENTPAEAIGHKSLAVNLSDLAAMGAEPAWFFMALTLPAVDVDWVDAFARGMGRLAARTGIRLAGGDVTSGPLSICVTALGLVDEGGALTRSGARPGDLVAVSGATGAAAHALRELEEGRDPPEASRAALDCPEPRVELGRRLREVATACIDISDGLLADLGHVLERSAVGAELLLERLPCPASLAGLPPAERWPLQLGGGDDYELCFTLPEAAWERLQPGLTAGPPALTVIGRITSSGRLVVRDPDGREYRPQHPGYEHFAGSDET